MTNEITIGSTVEPKTPWFIGPKNSKRLISGPWKVITIHENRDMMLKGVNQNKGRYFGWTPVSRWKVK